MFAVIEYIIENFAFYEYPGLSFKQECRFMDVLQGP